MRRRTAAGLVFLALCMLWTAAAPAQEDSGTAYVQEFDNGSINWKTGLVTAVGIGSPPANPVSPAQARALALRAATVVARRNLLELVKGVQIDSETTVRNNIVADDTVQARVRGYLQNSQVLDTAYMSDGSVEVIVGIRLRGGFADVIIPQTKLFYTPPLSVPTDEAPGEEQPEKPEPAPVAEAPTEPEPDEGPAPAIIERPLANATEAEAAPVTARPDYTGLVLDATGLQARPAMTPQIFDEEGNEVYGTAVVSREYAIQQGMAGYARDVQKASASERVGGQPLVVKAMEVRGQARTDFVVSNEAAENLRQVAADQGFLRQCRVMIVLD